MFKQKDLSTDGAKKAEHTLDMIKNIHEKIIEYGSDGNGDDGRYLQAPHHKSK
jgi:hypothetical protein